LHITSTKRIQWETDLVLERVTQLDFLCRFCSCIANTNNSLRFYGLLNNVKHENVQVITLCWPIAVKICIVSTWKTLSNLTQQTNDKNFRTGNKRHQNNHQTCPTGDSSGDPAVQIVT
jgi:hypothetical protein